MKIIKSAALIILAAAITAVSMSGCRLFAFMEHPSDPEAYSTAPSTAKATGEETTAEQTTAEQTTAEQTTAEANSSSAADAEIYNGAVMINSDTYYDSTLGITFTVPEWNGKVYAKGTYNGGYYSLAFYEATNYKWGTEKGWDGMGMLFTLMTSDTESSGDHIDYPAGSIFDGSKIVYLTYFKPTDVRYNYEDATMTESYQDVYQYQKDYFLSGLVDVDKIYVWSDNPNAYNLTSK